MNDLMSFDIFGVVFQQVRRELTSRNSGGLTEAIQTGLFE